MMIFSAQTLAEQTGLTLVHYASAGCGYEWDDFAVWIDLKQEGRWFWLTGSGCSCNWLLDGIEVREDLQCGARLDALRAVSNWNPYFDYDKSRLVAAVMDFKWGPQVDSL